MLTHYCSATDVSVGYLCVQTFDNDFAMSLHSNSLTIAIYVF